MKTPPFLLLAALLFWGWQSGFLVVGAIMGVLLESARIIRWRWELDDSDFNRIWSFCILLIVALAGFVFTTNEEVGGLSGLLHGSAKNAADSAALTTTRFMRWLPMTFFAFIAAQAYNARPTVPLTAISIVLGWRRRKGDQAFSGRYVNISYPYFIVCLFSAGIHANTGTKSYLLGQCILIPWALWTMRSRRFAVWVWLLVLAAVFGLGVLEIVGLHRIQGAVQNLNAQWMARLFGQRTDPLQSMTSMGRIGQMKLSAKIVIWLEPEKLGDVPTYLREASYRNYQARKMTWFAGGALNDFEPLLAEADTTSVVLAPERTNSSVVNVTCYLNGWSREDQLPEGLLPLPSGVSRLENIPANMIFRHNKNGAVLAAGLGLMIFNARYGPGVTMDAPPDLDSTNRFDLMVPPEETNALQQVVTEMDLPHGADEAQKRQAISKFFFDKFTYSLWQGPDKRADANATPLTRFLLTSRSGHCEYFATATVLLLRYMGIPARYAVGYSVHEPRGSGYIVRERDGHAWGLVWNSTNKCWEDFDTTPSTWVAIESRRTAWGEWFADLRSWLGLQYAKLRWRQAHLLQYILWALVPVMLVLLGHIIFRRRGKRRKNAGTVKIVPVIWPGLDSEFYELERKLAARGVPRQASEPLSDWLERALAEPGLANLRSPLWELLRLHYRHRFDPQGLGTDERESLRREAKACLDTLLAMKT